MKSPRTYSETGSVFRARSLGNGLDDVGLSSPEQHYEMSASFSSSAGAAILATPVRKSPVVQNGHTSPPLPPSSAQFRRGSPLLNDSRGSDYDTPRPSRPVSTIRQVSQKSRTSTNGSDNEGARESAAGNKKTDDSVDVGLDCIAQLEELERELRRNEAAASPPGPQRESREVQSVGRGSVGSSVGEESHYEVDPLYISRHSQWTQREGGGEVGGGGGGGGVY